MQYRTPLSDDQLKAQAPSIFAELASRSVSSKYSFLPTCEVVAEMRNNGWNPVKAMEQRVRTEDNRGFQKHLIRFVHSDQLARPGENIPEIVLTNSHDAKSAYQIHAGIFRLVCGNGMVIADSTFNKVSVRHSHTAINDVIHASMDVLAEVPRVTEEIEQFKARRLSDAEAQAYAEAALILRYDTLPEAPITPVKLLTPHRREDAQPTLWNTFNRIQENITKGGQKDYSRRKPDGQPFTRTRAINSISEDTRINKALWHIATVLNRFNDVPAIQPTA